MTMTGRTELLAGKDTRTERATSPCSGLVGLADLERVD